MDKATAASYALALVSGGGITAFLREKRKGKSDQSQSMLDFVREWGDQFKEQNRRLDELNREIGVLTGRLLQLTETNVALVTENTALKSENLRLETALQTEVTKATALAAMPRASRHTDITIEEHAT